MTDKKIFVMGLVLVGIFVFLERNFFWGLGFVGTLGKFVILSAAKNPHFKGANSHFKFVDTSLSYESSV